MGRMEETGQAVRSTVERTRDVVDGTSARVTGTLLDAIEHHLLNHPRLTTDLDMELSLKEILGKQNIVLGDCADIIGFMNQLYSFVASSPGFDAANGTGKKA